MAMLTEKDLALRLLQMAVAQLLPQALVSIRMEQLLNQLQKVQGPPQEREQPPYRWASHPSLPLCSQNCSSCSVLSSQVRLVGSREGSLALARAWAD